jgi:hypothetical protein
MGTWFMRTPLSRLAGTRDAVERPLTTSKTLRLHTKMTKT